MIGHRYKKLAGTSAVFILDGYSKSSPIERDGLSWTSEELQLTELPKTLSNMPTMANGLALEGLEEYLPPRNGETRYVESLESQFIYIEKIKAWIQLK